jgi:glycosyltransferase involved in cell wall biosynthesis
MDGLGLELRIGAASNWSRKKNTLRDVTLPGNIAVNSYGYLGLRQLYDSALFVVVPLQDVDFQAGITTVLEGMAMGRAVISTLTTGRQRAFEGPLWRAGLSDWPSDGPCLDLASGIYVPPADPAALHAAMRFLRDHPLQADIIGANARRRVEDGFAVEQFAARMAQAILRA